jgi:hypothetical protein
MNITPFCAVRRFLLMTIGATVVSISYDMTEGIIARFRTMAIHRGSVPSGTSSAASYGSTN